jgi:hypothetical protein
VDFENVQRRLGVEWAMRTMAQARKKQSVVKHEDEPRVVDGGAETMRCAQMHRCERSGG